MAVLILIVFISSPAFSWGAYAHKITAEIAVQNIPINHGLRYKDCSNYRRRSVFLDAD